MQRTSLIAWTAGARQRGDDMSTWRLQVVGDHDRLHDAFIDAETSTRSAISSGR